MRRACLVGVLSLLVACGSPAPVRFSDGWPAAMGGYAEVTQAWTRADTLHHDFKQILKVEATLESQPWFAAWSARQAAMAAWDDAELARQRAIWEALPYHELAVVVTTWERDENNLHHADTPAWRMELTVDGVRYAPDAILRDDRPDSVIVTDFPGQVDFARTYKVRFNKARVSLGAATRDVSLRVYGALGAVQLKWM